MNLRHCLESIVPSQSLSALEMERRGVCVCVCCGGSALHPEECRLPHRP